MDFLRLSLLLLAEVELIPLQVSAIGGNHGLECRDHVPDGAPTNPLSYRHGLFQDGLTLLLGQRPAIPGCAGHQLQVPGQVPVVDQIEPRISLTAGGNSVALGRLGIAWSFRSFRRLTRRRHNLPIFCKLPLQFSPLGIPELLLVLAKCSRHLVAHWVTRSVRTRPACVDTLGSFLLRNT